MNRFTGICIGGLASGKQYVSQSPFLLVEEGPPAPLLRPVASRRDIMSPSVRQNRYRHLQPQGWEVGFWVLDNMDFNEVIGELALVYVEHHKSKESNNYG